VAKQQLKKNGKINLKKRGYVGFEMVPKKCSTLWQLQGGSLQKRRFTERKEDLGELKINCERKIQEHSPGAAEEKQRGLGGHSFVKTTIDTARQRHQKMGLFSGTRGRKT